MARKVSLFLLALAFLLPASNAHAFLLELGVGVKGGMNGSIVDGVPENEPYQLGNQMYIDPDIYPMFGLGGSFGLALELRALGIVGLETGVLMSWDNGNGWEDIKNERGQVLIRINQHQRTSALHIPILVKASVPGALVRPTFGLGVMIVSQRSSTLEYDNPDIVPGTRQADTSTYPLGMATLGLEFNLVKIRVPLELRLGYNLGFTNTVAARVDVEGTSPSNAVYTYDGAYQGHFMLMTGIVYDFDFLL